jgi:hypothetical protein
MSVVHLLIEERTMSEFCVQCGTPICQGAGFCTGCGTKSDSPNSPEQRASQQAVPPANTADGATARAIQKGSKKKLILATLGGVLVLGGIAVGGMIYVGYRAATKASQVRGEGSLGSLVREAAQEANETSGTDGEKHVPGQRDACSLASKEEVASAAGTTFSATTLGEDRNVCTYEPGEDSEVTVVVDVKWRDGNLAMRALPGFTAQLGQEDIRHRVQGIGDEAYLLGVDEETQQSLDKALQALRGLSSFATGPLVFRKRDVWVVVTATMAENKADVQKRIAQIIAGRI